MVGATEIDPDRRREIAAEYWNLASQHGEGHAASHIGSQYGMPADEVLKIAAEFPRGKDENPLARSEDKDPQPGD